MNAADETRFWSKVEKHPDGCWIWHGTTRGPSRGWYGVFMAAGRRQGAHRWSYELAYGPIPDGFFVCHHCDNPPCVRPDHLFAGTATDNTNDRRRKGRKLNVHMSPERARATAASRRKCPGNRGWKLTPDDVQEIRRLRDDGVPAKDVASRFGVTVNTIAQIRSGTRWIGTHAMTSTERFDKSLTIDEDGDGCWHCSELTPRHWERNRVETAKDYSYRLAYGEIPSEMMVRQSCKVNDCVRPDHLFLSAATAHSPFNREEIAQRFHDGESSRDLANEFYVTTATITNIHREIFGRTRKIYANLTQEQIETIRAMLRSGVSQQKIAKTFGCSQSVVSGIYRKHSEDVLRHRGTEYVPRAEHGLSVSERFWRRVAKDSDDGCWIWRGCINHGAPMFSPGSQEPISASRYAYEQLVAPIPKGLYLVSLCGNRACVRPNHRSPQRGTHIQNNAA